MAILGTPIDQIYPKINDSLAARILERGAILSEYAPGTDIRSWHFLERNRIVAGLCDALLIVEASERSGTLTTASMAINSGKDIFVVPGDLTRPMSIGCNRMIRSGANIYTCIDDILDCVLPKHARRAMVERTFRNELEKTIYASIKSGISDGDEIVSQLQISTSELNQALTMMQLRGLVMPLGANHWATIAG